MLRRAFFKMVAGALAAPYIGIALRPLAERWMPNVWLGCSTVWHDSRNWTLGHSPRAKETVMLIGAGGECVIPAGTHITALCIHKGAIRMEVDPATCATIDRIAVGLGDDISIGAVGKPLRTRKGQASR